jgi:hypothetical protein
MRATPLLLLLAACAAPPPPPIPELSRPPERRIRGDEVVALLDGQPLTWQKVAEKTLELDLKGSVDQYVRWKIVEDRRLELGIRHEAAELKRRAELYLEQVKSDLGHDGWRRKLLDEGIPEAEYLRRLEGSAFLSQILLFDKIVRYADLVEDTIEADAAVLATAAEADALEKSGADRAWPGRLAFPRSRPPAGLPAEAVLGLRKGPPGVIIRLDSPEAGRYSLWRLKAVKAGRKEPYGELRREVWDALCARPPGPEDYQRWMDAALAGRSLRYGPPPVPR